MRKSPREIGNSFFLSYLLLNEKETTHTLSDMCLMTSNSSKSQQKDTFLRCASAHLQQGPKKPTKITNNPLYYLYSYLNMIKVQNQSNFWKQEMK